MTCVHFVVYTVIVLSYTVYTKRDNESHNTWRMKMAKIDKSVMVAVAEVEVAVAEVKISKRVRVYSAGEAVVYEVKMPVQLKQIVDFLVETKFKGTGTEIIEKMIEAGKITTRQNPAVLFAFYARRLEGMGIVRG